MTELWVPDQYHLRAVERMVENKGSGAWMEQGLGKTSCVLATICELRDRLIPSRTLVVAPPLVAAKGWPDEVAKWTQFCHLRVSCMTGSKNQRINAMNRPADIYTISYDNLMWLIDETAARGIWPWNIVVFDESSKMKNPNAKRVKKMIKHIDKADRVIQLTGTPAGKGLLDLWTQAYLLDRGQRLGTKYWGFRERWFKPDWTGYNWTPKEGTKEDIYNRMSDIVFSMSKRDYLSLPKVTPHVHRVPMSLNARSVYEKVEDMYFEGDSDVTGATLIGKQLQVCNGAVYTGDGEWEEVHTGKLDMLEDIFEEAAGDPLLVAYQYQHDAARIRQRFGKNVTMLGRDPKVIDQWNAGEIPMLLAHPGSAAHGLNLQHGGHIAVWFGLSWSLEHVLQFNARLDRRGQTKPVFIHYITMENTVEERVVEVIQTKNATQRDLLNSVRLTKEEVEA